VSGISATRRSPSAVSLGTPILMDDQWAVLARWSGRETIRAR
jgi:hypothetical protein